MPFIASPNTFKNDSAKLNRKWGTITKRSNNHGGLSGNEAHWNTTTPAVILVLFDSGFVNKRESANDNMISEICLQKLLEKMLAEGLLLSVSSLISEQKSSPARPGNGKTKPDVKGKKNPFKTHRGKISFVLHWKFWGQRKARCTLSNCLSENASYLWCRTDHRRRWRCSHTGSRYTSPHTFPHSDSTSQNCYSGLGNRAWPQVWPSPSLPDREWCHSFVRLWYIPGTPAVPLQHLRTGRRSRKEGTQRGEGYVASGEKKTRRRKGGQLEVRVAKVILNARGSILICFRNINILMPGGSHWCHANCSDCDAVLETTFNSFDFFSNCNSLMNTVS